MINDALIEAITKIGNLPGLIKACEPNIMQPLILEEWMVRRSLQALALFQEEYENDLRRTNQKRTRTIRQEE